VTVRTGSVRADGTSTLVPRGVYDMASMQADISPDLEKKVSELVSKMDARETHAQFKLELFMRGGPRHNAEVRGVVSFWTNGGYLHGGGDAVVYLCPQILDSGEPCGAPIDSQFITPKQAVCVKCRRVSNALDLCGQLVIETTVQHWARILVRLFHLLECNADISLSVERASLRAASEKELASYRGGEEYARVTALRECITYPLAHIIKDTAAGAGLEERFRAFLEA
jgi:hypothetical protein